MNTEPIISCRGLWKLYGPDPAAFLERHGENVEPALLRQSGYIPAVRRVDISVYPGEILVVMGLSGSGKSTLVRLLARLIEPTVGSIHFQGADLLAASAREMIEIRRHKMGMVFQHFALLPHCTVLENVAFPLEVQGVGRTERQAAARELIALVGLEGREGYYPHELSGGQQQRVGIARSLVVDPDIWFLDEPFSALDPLIRREMQDEFLRLQSRLHKTIVFITHDFDEAIRLSDRTVIMSEGEIHQAGAPEQLLLSPATDHVREFTRGIAREKVLTVRSIMEPPAAGVTPAVAISRDERLAAVAHEILQSRQDTLAVHDEQGAVVGLVRRQRFIDAVFSKADAVAGG